MYSVFDIYFRIYSFNLVKRESWNLEKYVPCTSLAECLGNFNLIFPIRLNFNPITAYDRLKSHYQGNKGWSNKEIQKFESLKNKIKRINAKINVKNRIHLAEMKMWRTRILRRREEWLAFRSKSEKIDQNQARRLKRHAIKNSKVWPYPYWPLRYHIMENLYLQDPSTLFIWGRTIMK
jgi:hypothetical protein